MKLQVTSLLLLVLFALPAWGATYHFRPNSECPAFNGNGTSAACALSNGGVGAWRGGTGVAQATPGSGDVVKACHQPGGSFTTADADTATVMLVINWSASGVVLDGDCSSEGLASRAVFDGGGTHDRGLDSGSSGAASVAIRNIDFRGFDVHAIIGQNAASTNWTIDGITCDGSFSTSTCIRNLTAGATGWVIEDSDFNNCGVDCIYTANPLTLRRVTGDEWSINGVEGDFLQSTGTSCNGFVFEDVELESSTDIKQGLLMNSCTDAGNVTVTRGKVIKRGLSADSSLGMVPLFVEASSGTVTVNGWESRGGRKSIFVSGGVSLVARSSVFGPTLTQNIQCGSSTVACTVEHNSIAGGTIGIDMQAAGAGGNARNNAISRSAIGISKGASGSESYNAIDSPDPCWSGGATAACAGTDVLENVQFLGGANPTTAEGFRLKPNSPLIGAGIVGAKYDYDNNRCGNPSNIGAFCTTYQDTRSSYTTRTDY